MTEVSPQEPAAPLSAGTSARCRQFKSLNHQKEALVPPEPGEGSLPGLRLLILCLSLYLGLWPQSTDGQSLIRITSLRWSTGPWEQAGPSCAICHGTSPRAL